MTTSNFHDNWVYHTGGGFNLSFNISWAVSVSGNTTRRSVVQEPKDEWLEAIRTALYELRMQETSSRNVSERTIEILEPLYSYRPLQQAPFFKQFAPWYHDWLDHPELDPYWQSVNIAAQYNRVHVSVLHLTGWYDLFLGGSIANYLGMVKHGPTPEVRRSQKLIIGPWVHGPVTLETTQVGDMNFGSQAGIDLTDIQLNWFDHWLKGHSSSLRDEAPIQLFVMGDNLWRAEQEWPLARTQWTHFYLHSGGYANTLDGDGILSTDSPEMEPYDRFKFDPGDPVPTRGGCLRPIGGLPGIFDQREIETRPDVLIYTSAVLSEDIEVTGPIIVELWASTSAPDTDFTAKLVDVYPDGYAMNLCDGIIRARYRTSPEKPSLLRPGVVYSYRIDLWATSNVFKAGHQIRLEISSSNFPRFEPNPNTGHIFGTDSKADLQVAEQKIYH